MKASISSEKSLDNNNNDTNKSADDGKDNGVDDMELIEISRGCFRLSRLGGGWVPLPNTNTNTNSNDKKSKKDNSKPSSTTPQASGISHGNSSVFSSSNGGDNNGYDDWYLILEDDSEVILNNITEGLQITINKIIQQKLPKDFDICYLGHVIPKNCLKTFFRGGEIVKPNYAWCLHGYILRGKAINKLLNNLPINSPVDNFIGQLLFDGLIEVFFFIFFSSTSNCSLHCTALHCTAS